ncbi:hypothetical protein [Sphingomonas sp.]|uniref:hypothetical protein n=1 Tax=Sphingomonas sp. TaxID=28214 RepID=UPI003BAD2072
MAERKNAAITLLGRDWEIAPYKLGSMIKAAEFVDAVKARNEAIVERLGAHVESGDTADDLRVKALQIAAGTSLVEMMQTIRDAVSVLHIGIAKIDPSVTVDQLLDDIDNDAASMAAIIEAMNLVLGQSGLQSGEAMAPAPLADAPGASGKHSAA